MGNWGIWQILVVLAIVILVFGTSRMRNIGSDLGNAIKGFRKAMSDDSSENQNDVKSADDAKSADDSDTPDSGDSKP